MEQIVNQLAHEYKASLQKLYGHQLAELVLFGSYARGEQQEESDIDFAVVLHGQELAMSELDKMVPITTQLSLKYGIMVSTLPVSLEKKQNSNQGVYIDIRKEGIVI